MKVYVVKSGVMYEGGYIIGIYDTLKKAEKAKKEEENSIIGNDWVDIEEYEVE